MEVIVPEGNFWEELFTSVGLEEDYEKLMEIKRSFNQTHCFQCVSGAGKCCGCGLEGNILRLPLFERFDYEKYRHALFRTNRACLFLSEKGLCLVEKVKPYVCFRYYCSKLPQTEYEKAYKVIRSFEDCEEIQTWRKKLVGGVDAFVRNRQTKWFKDRPEFLASLSGYLAERYPWVFEPYER